MRTDPRPNGNTNNSFIARRRIALGMTQKQLADAVGSTQQMVARWEQGKRDPRSTTLIKLSDALGCSVDELVQS